MLSSKLIKRLLAASGAYRFAMGLFRWDGCIVLNYHNVLPRGVHSDLPFKPLHVYEDEFKRHCEVISRYCTPLTLSQFCSYLSNSESWPDRAVLVTFDDAYRTLLTHAIPALQELSIPSCIFVATNVAATRTLHWFDAMAYAADENAVQHAKKLPYDQWITLANSVRRSVSADHPLSVMSLDELTILSKLSFVEIGSHTVLHPILKMASREVQRKEMEDSKQVLEGITRRPVRAIAYPNGQYGVDFDHATMTIAQAVGYELGFSTTPGVVNKKSPRYALPRQIMLEGVDDAELVHRIAWGWHRNTTGK